MVNFWYNLIVDITTKFNCMEDIKMDFLGLLADIWDSVMTILINAGVDVADWKNPFRKDAE